MGLGIALLSGTAVASADTDSGGADAGTSVSRDAGDSDAAQDTDTPSSSSRDTDEDEPSTKATKRDKRTDDEPSDTQDDAETTSPDDEDDATPAPEQGAADADDVTQPSAGDADGSDVTDPVIVPVTDETTEPSSTEPAVEPAATGREDGGSTPRAGPLSLVADNPTAAAAEPENSWWDNLVREFSYTFFNKAPTLSPTDVTETTPGVITGNLNGQSNNGFGLTYAIKTGPKHGTLTIDQVAGTYTYTYDPSTFTDETEDSFVIVADNGTEARKTGLGGLVQLVMHNLAISLRLSQRDTTESNFTVSAKNVDEQLKVTLRGTGFYGNLSNSRYWAEQNYADNCMLMSILMIEGQFTGQVPTRAIEDAIVAQAKVTPSVVNPGKMMYLGDDNEDGVLPKDAVALLKIRGYDATLRYFPAEKADASFQDGLGALDVVSKLLLNANGVLVGVNNNTIWDATEDEGTPGGANRITANHGIVVIAVDTHNGKVYINDPGVSGGKALAVPLGAFMWAWESDAYETIVVEKPVAQSQVAPQSSELALAA